MEAKLFVNRKSLLKAGLARIKAEALIYRAAPGVPGFDLVEWDQFSKNAGLLQRPVKPIRLDDDWFGDDEYIVAAGLYPVRTTGPLRWVCVLDDSQTLFPDWDEATRVLNQAVERLIEVGVDSVAWSVQQFHSADEDGHKDLKRASDIHCLHPELAVHLYL